MTLPISQDLSDTQPVPLGMGKLVETFPINRRSRHYGQAVAGFVFFLLLGLGLLGVGGVFTYFSVAQYGPSVTWKWIEWPLILGLTALLVGMITWIRFLAFHRQVLELYEYGFIFRDWRSITAWRWGELSAIQEKVTRQSIGVLKGPVRRFYRLTSPLHKDLLVDDRFRDVNQFIEQIQQAIFPKRYLETARQYNEGDLLTFGPVSLNKTGITLRQKVYVWEALAPGQVNQGFLVFPLVHSAASGAIRIPTEQIPNLDVLVAILKYIQQ